MGGACQRREKEPNILNVDIKHGKIQRLELAVMQPFRLFYEYDEEKDAIIVYMLLSDGTYERKLFAYMPSENIMVERLLSKFVSTFVVPEVLQYVEKITANIDRRGAKIKIGDDDGEGKLQEGLAAKFGYRQEENKYYVYADAAGYYKEEEYQCYVHEHDYVVDEKDIKPRLMRFAQNVVAIASTCVPTH